MLEDVHVDDGDVEDLEAVVLLTLKGHKEVCGAAGDQKDGEDYEDEVAADFVVQRVTDAEC